MRTSSIRAAIVAAVITVGSLLGAGSASAATVAEKDPVFAPTSGQTTMSVLVTKLTHAQATARFRDAGITWSSSGNCSNRNNSTCTSFEQINLATVQGAETLKRACGCSLNITGGTETGHASGTYSHWNGYKLDFTKYSGIGNYIHNNFTYIGGSKWQAASGNIYYDEVNHWDVTFYSCGC